MKIYFTSIALVLFIFSCSKTNNNQRPASTSVDVSCQQYTDFLGNLLATSGTCPSVIDTSFTPQQIALFNSLDTTDLSGTIKPDTSSFIAFYPNPFQVAAGFSSVCSFAHSSSGQVVAKFVITDSLLNPLFKATIRLSFNTPRNSVTVALRPPVNAGRFRLFYTLSAQSNNNFSRGWINITGVN